LATSAGVDDTFLFVALHLVILFGELGWFLGIELPTSKLHYIAGCCQVAALVILLVIIGALGWHPAINLVFPLPTELNTSVLILQEEFSFLCAVVIIVHDDDSGGTKNNRQTKKSSSFP
jgi:hypothetical protein